MDMTIHQIAKVCHETNKAFCDAIGDTSQKHWDEAEDWQRKSSMAGVEMHLKDLMKGVQLDPSYSHEVWMKEKLTDGWRYGPVKDGEKKTHPCLVPYKDLPLEQRMKDYLFIAVVTAFFTAR